VPIHCSVSLTETRRFVGRPSTVALSAIQMDPGEQYDMVFNGAAPRDAGVMATSPGRYSGADNGWTMALVSPIITEVSETFKKYPNIPTILSGASLGSDLPEFTLPNLVAPSGAPSSIALATVSLEVITEPTPPARRRVPEVCKWQPDVDYDPAIAAPSRLASR